MRNFRALIACALGVMLIGTTLSAADADGTNVQAELAQIRADIKRLNDARTSMGMTLPFTVDGYVDVTGNYNFNRSPSRQSLARAYATNADTFTLNVAQVNFHRDAAKGSIVGFNVQLDFGENARVQNTATNPTGTYNDVADIEAAYIDILVPGHEDCGITAGKFATWEGIEVMESTLNPVISRGFLFLYAEPLTHVGVFTHYTHDVNGMDLNVKLGAVNGWDLEADNNADKDFIWYIGLTKSKLFDAHLNGTWGDEQTASGGTTGHKAGHPRTSVDLTGYVNPMGPSNTDLTINYQLNWGSEKDPAAGIHYAHWAGMAIEPVYVFSNSPNWSLAGRFEVFDDHSGVRANGLTADEPQTMYNITLCPAYKVSDACTVRGEYRYDWSNLNRGTGGRAFEDSKGADNLDHQSTLMIELLYSFTTAPTPQ